MRTLSRIACAALVGTALFGVVGLSSTATAAPARPLGTTATVIGDDDVSTSATRAFWIENRTSEGMTVYGLKGAGDVLLPEDSLPENRYIGPGQTLRVEVTSGYFSNGGHQVEVSLMGDKVRWRAARIPRVLPGQVGRVMTESDRSRMTAAPTPSRGSPTTRERDWC